MKKVCSFSLMIFLISCALLTGSSWAQQEKIATPDIYSGFYSREENYGKVARESGNSHYVKFYPENRIIRLYIPFPYSKSLKAEAINAAFDTIVKTTTGSAYIRDKFGVMEQQSVAHTDTFRWIDGQAMYDCGKARPCKIEFEPDSMTVIEPGVVMEHRVSYERVLNN
ncbi:MAG TPA: hypothetical protein VIU36_06415 [Gammaproteobacteria bacterium]|jgi:hypothetical protein